MNPWFKQLLVIAFSLLTLFGCSSEPPIPGQSGSELSCTAGEAGDALCQQELGDDYRCAASGFCEQSSAPTGKADDPTECSRFHDCAQDEICVQADGSLPTLYQANDAVCESGAKWVMFEETTDDDDQPEWLIGGQWPPTVDLEFFESLGATIEHWSYVPNDHAVAETAEKTGNLVLFKVTEDSVATLSSYGFEEVERGYAFPVSQCQNDNPWGSQIMLENWLIAWEILEPVFLHKGFWAAWTSATAWEQIVCSSCCTTELNKLSQVQLIIISQKPELHDALVNAGFEPFGLSVDLAGANM